MSANCKCLKPEGGGTKCPTQHIALCIRGKDRECYGECIPIPDDFRKVSKQFTYWSENQIREKVVEYMKEFARDYKAFGPKDQVSRMLRKETEFDFQNLSGRQIYSTRENDRIVVTFSFSFEENADPNERQMLAY